MSSPSRHGPKRDHEIWYNDGNVVILAEDIAFRVYQGILSSVSPLFADLFSLPQPDGLEMIDGCPVVHMSDSPTDLRHFLSIVTKSSIEYVPNPYNANYIVL